MSTFTQWNGPQGASGPSAKDMLALVEAYNNLSTKLAAHIEAVAPTDTAIHGIVSYVKDIKTQLEALIGTKATTEALDTVKTTADAAATKIALNEAVANIEELIAAKASNSALDEKADKTTTAALSNQITALITVVDNLKTDYESHIAHITDEVVLLAFDCAIKTATYIIGKIKAFKVIDFTKWAHFSAPFAGTGSLSDTSTNGAFIIGCLSLDWSDDVNAPAEEYAHKAARAYVKYVNSNPFDAICDMVVTNTDEGYVGSLTVHLAKKAGTWKDLAFHLILGTNSKHTKCVYLAVSSKGLASTNADYSNTNFRACGENFIPVGEDGYITPTGMLEGITSAVIGTNANSITGADNLRINQLWSQNYFDGDGYNLLKVVSTIDPDNDTTYHQVFIGDANHDEITFIKRPSMIVETEEGEQVQAYFVTARDITNVTLPVGAIIRWAPVNDDGSLKNIPSGYLACDGSKVSNIDYPELCELLGYDEYGMSTLPDESHSIIKAVFFTIIDKVSQPDYDELVEFSMLNKKINKEIARAESAESGLSERITTNTENISANTSAIENEIARAQGVEETLADSIDANTEAIAAETARAQNAERTLTDNLTAETARAEEAEQANADAITAETARAEEAEKANADAIAAEVTRATTAEQQTISDIATETARATAAEDVNAAAIAAETSRAIDAETTLNMRVDHYEVMEDRLQANITAEQTRAEEAEQANADAIAAEQTRAEEAEQANTNAITAEQTRAEEAENKLQDNITAEQTRAEEAENKLQANITAEQTRAEEAEQANANAITAEQTRAEEAEAAEAATRAAQDVTVTQSVAAETQRAVQAEQDLSDRINQLHPNE